MNKYGYVYLITNKINGKKYVGMHKSSSFDPMYYGSGVAISNAVKKYGKENFSIEILHWCSSAKELQIMEQYELSSRKVSQLSDYYNIIETSTPILYGADNGFYGKHHSEEVKQYLREILTGKPISEEHRNKLINYANSEKGKQHYKKLSEDRKGKSISEEHKKKIQKSTQTPEFRENASKNSILFYQSDKGMKVREETSKRTKSIMTGRPKSEEHKMKISESNKGKKHSYMTEVNRCPEKIKKTVMKNTGLTRSDETKSKISAAKKGKPAHNKGSFYVYHEETLQIITIKPGEEIPDGCKKGRKPKV